MKFNEKLLNLREKNDLSQEELAEKLNVTRQTISKWEMGNCYTDMGKLLEMCKVFNCELSELLDDGILPNNNVTENKTVIPKVLLIIILLALIVIGYLSFRLYAISNNFNLYLETTQLYNLNMRYQEYFGESKSGTDVIELIDLINENNMYLEENNIDSFREKYDWCVYIYSEIRDISHKEVKFYEYSDDETNYPYTQYDSSVIDPLKHYKVTTEWYQHPDLNINRITKINITEVIP